MTAIHIETDVLVIGGGGAGFRAAIGAAEKGAAVTLASKGPLGRCGATPMAGADYTLDGKSLKKLNFNGAENDSDEKMFNDIVTQGFFLNNQKLVEQYIKSAPECLKELLDWGIEIAFSEERAVFTSGLHIMDTLLKKARSMGVRLLEDIMIIDLVSKDGSITGGLGLDIKTGDFIRFNAGAVIMATGGWHKAFWPNTGMRDLSGEGIAMAERAGATIGNMEFITFCCNIFYHPPVWRGSLAPYVLGMMAGHKLTNASGETFLDQYDAFTVKTATQMEWNKSFISMASAKEIREGRGGPNGGIFFQRGEVPWDTIKFFAQVMFPNWKYKGLDLTGWGKKLETNEPVEVGPAVEYFDGGIVVDDQFHTNIQGLFAAGECTLGLFGANRVFSAITEMLVQGRSAGRNAGEYALSGSKRQADQNVFTDLEKLAALPLTRGKGVQPTRLLRRLQEKAHQNLGPVRNKEELSRFITFLANLKNESIPFLAAESKHRNYNREWIHALELKNMVQLLEASAKSALYRTESRGVHFREDIPDTDNDNWLLETRVLLNNDEVTIGSHPVTCTQMELPKGRLPYLEMMKNMMAAHSDIGGHH